jgi:hypothetical protein
MIVESLIALTAALTSIRACPIVATSVRSLDLRALTSRPLRRVWGGESAHGALRQKSSRAAG